MNVETKDINLKVKGKDGLTQAITIQKHKPTAPMCFIRTTTGHMLFCQEDHPIWIQTMDGQTTVVEAKDAVMFHDRIWVDNTKNIEFSNEESLNTHNNFFNKLLLISNGLADNSIYDDSEYFIGDSKYNFYINPSYLYKMDKANSTVMLLHFLSLRWQTTPIATPPEKIKLYSFNYVSQLKSLADSLQYNCRFDINFENDDVYWTLHDAKETFVPINDISDYVDIEQVISGIENYQGYVYDLKTESEEFLNNNVQTHNSFHTGGAVEFKKIAILKELGANITAEDETHLARNVYQKENDLYSNAPVIKVLVDKTLFKDEYAIKKEDGVYKLSFGYFVMTIGTLEVLATIELPVELQIPTDVHESATQIALVYGQDDKILHIKNFSIAPEKVAAYLDQLVGGKSPWVSPESLLMKFHNNLKDFNPYDMCHLEVIISSILRNRKDPMIPARLKEPYDPVTYSIKSLPSVISWSLGMAYENISKSIATGLISDDVKNLSQIEKVLFGEPLSDLSIEKLKERSKKK